MVLASQTELSDGQMNPTLLVRLQPCWCRSIPLRQQVESCHCEGQACLEVDPDTVSHMLDVANGVQHGKYRLNHHARVPLPSLAYEQVSGIALFEGKELVSQHYHFLLILSNHRVESRIMNISCGTIPIDNRRSRYQPPLVEEHAQ